MIRRILFLMMTLAGLTAAQMEIQQSALSALPSFEYDAAQTALLPGGVRLMLRGGELPYDSKTDTYYLPVSKEAALAERGLTLESEPGVTYGAVHETDGSMTLYAGSGEGVRASSVVFTSLPVIALESESGGLPGDEAERGTLVMLTGENGRLALEKTDMEINLRGNTSRRLPKKSYRVKIIENSGEKKNMAIAGLRSDDDWILNPMYSDTSKIREPLSYWLWEQIDSSGGAAASSRAAYAEVLINGEYWGLYGVQERIDRKQVNADKRSGVLYKIYANDRPTVQELAECADAEICRGFEVSHAGTAVGDALWAPAATYMAALNGETNVYGASLSIENTIDYGLFAMLTQAYDCHFKNQFLNCVYTGSGYTMYKIPWDLNHTFGDAWNGDSQQTNYLDYLIGDELVFDGAFSVMLDCADETVLSMIRDRWEELRSGAVTYERIIDKAYALYLPLQDALARDSVRWPGSGMGDGNALHIRDIEVFVQGMLPRVDEFVRTL